MDDRDARQSKPRRWLVLAGGALACYWLALVVGTHYPFPHGIPTDYSDKELHFGAYAGLAFMGAAAWTARWGLRPVGWAIVWVAVVMHGAIDEWTQPPFGRTCELLDWVADVLGASLGMALFLAIAGAVTWAIRRRAKALANSRADKITEAIAKRDQ